MFRFAQHDKIPIVIASVSEAIKRHRIPMILASYTVGCHARPMCSLAMTHPLAPSAREGAESHNNKNGRNGGATLVAHITWESHIKSAVKTAPPKIPFVLLSVSETSLLDSASLLIL